MTTTQSPSAMRGAAGSTTAIDLVAGSIGCSHLAQSLTRNGSQSADSWHTNGGKRECLNSLSQP